jgi:hypothetical protein
MILKLKRRPTTNLHHTRILALAKAFHCFESTQQLITVLFKQGYRTVSYLVLLLFRYLRSITKGIRRGIILRSIIVDGIISALLLQ